MTDEPTNERVHPLIPGERPDPRCPATSSSGERCQLHAGHNEDDGHLASDGLVEVVWGWKR